MSYEESTERDPRNGVQVIARAVQILRELSTEPEGLSLSQIAERVGLARSTVHRIVQALTQEHLIVGSSRNGGVRLGPGLATLAAGARRELRTELRPHLVDLSRDLDETVDLAVLEGDRVLFVDQVLVPHRLAAVSSVGATFPVHCTANGKALLASLSEQQLDRMLPRRLERFTAHTVTDRRRLFAQLDEVRRTGVATDREEHTLGICAVGCLVQDSLGSVAAVTVPLPSTRFSGKEKELASRLSAACVSMSKALGRD